MKLRTFLFATLGAALTVNVPATAEAQTVMQKWVARYDGPAHGNEYAQATAADGSGNVVVTGTSLNGSNNDIYTAKYAAADGALVWENRYNGPANGDDWGLSVAVDGTGNAIVTGFSRGSGTTGNDIYTAKYAAADGALLWEKRYDGTGHYDDLANSVAVDAAGNVAIVGVSKGVGSMDYYTAKYAAADGALLWEKRYEGPGTRDDLAYSVAMDSAGNVVVTGGSSNTNNANFSNNDFYTAKYAAANGALLWEKRYNGPANQADVATSVAVDGSGNVVVTGYSYNSSSEDIYTAKYAAATGALVWEKRYNGAVDGRDRGASIAVDAAGNVAITGESFNGRAIDMYTAKYAAADGALLWEKRYAEGDNGNGDNGARSVKMDAAGNVVVAGQSYNGLNFDYYTAKYEGTTGTLLWEARYDGPASGHDRNDLSYIYPLPGKLALTPDGGAVVTGESYNGANYDFATVRYGPADGTTTLLPTLTAPASGTTSGSPVAVSYTLPEAAAAGTVTLSFNDGTERTLHLTGESAGMHSFAFDPADPVATSGGAVASGVAIPDGTYTVTLAYQDALSNPAASASSTNVTIRTAPVTDPVTTVLYSKGGAVPGAGAGPGGGYGPGEVPPGAVWKSLGVPAVNDGGKVAFLGGWSAAATAGGAAVKTTGIFLSDTGGVPLVAVGDPVPGAGSGGIPSEAIFKSLKDPVLDEAGHVAFLAVMKGRGITGGNDGVVVTNAGGTLAVVAVEKSAAPGADGAGWKSFAAVSLHGTAGSESLLFTATLKSSAATDRGAWLWTPAGGTTLAVREGGTATGFAVGEKIRNFKLQVDVGGSTGHGGQHLGNGTAQFSATLSTGRQALLRADGSLAALALTGDPLGGTALPAATWKTFGPARSSDDGAIVTLSGVLTNNVGGVSGTAATGIFQSTDDAATWEPVAQIGDGAPGFAAGQLFSALKDPVSSAADAGLAFLGTLKGGGVKANMNTGVWWQPDGGALTLLAGEGAQAAECPTGAVWSSFTSLALPGGTTGPLFVARLLPGKGGVKAMSDYGLWAVDNAGALRLLVREGATLDGRTVKIFTVLKATSGSAGVARAYTNNGDVVLLVNFTDATQSIVEIAVP